MLLSNVKVRDVEIPTSSLADIVFLLLIFFLVTTNIDTEKAIGLVLPDNDIVKPVNPDNLVNILINASGQIALDGELIKSKDITYKIREMLREQPNLIVSLQTNQHTKYDLYIDVLDRLKQAWGNNPSRISIAEPVK